MTQSIGIDIGGNKFLIHFCYWLLQYNLVGLLATLIWTTVPHPAALSFY